MLPCGGDRVQFSSLEHHSYRCRVSVGREAHATAGREAGATSSCGFWRLPWTAGLARYHQERCSNGLATCGGANGSLFARSGFCGIPPIRGKAANGWGTCHLPPAVGPMARSPLARATCGGANGSLFARSGHLRWGQWLALRSLGPPAVGPMARSSLARASVVSHHGAGFVCLQADLIFDTKRISTLTISTQKRVF